MVQVKLQERTSQQGKNKYITYVVTLPKSVIEALPKIRKSKKLNVFIEDGKIVLAP